MTCIICNIRLIFIMVCFVFRFNLDNYYELFGPERNHTDVMNSTASVNSIINLPDTKSSIDGYVTSIYLYGDVPGDIELLVRRI